MKSYKGQLSPGMSFTMSYRKSILLVGPARASSYFQRIEQETSSSPVPWKKPLKRSSKTQLSITSKNRKILTLKTFITTHPKKEITDDVFTRKLCHKK